MMKDVTSREKKASLEKLSVNLRPHYKPSLISLQEPWILQVFSVYSWYLKKSLDLLNVLKDYGESW